MVLFCRIFTSTLACFTFLSFWTRTKNVRSFLFRRWLCIYTRTINKVWNKNVLGLYRLSNHAEMKNSTHKHRITTIVIFWLLLFLFEGMANMLWNICITNPAFQWYCFPKTFFSMIAQNFCHFTSRNIKDNVGIIICIIINLNFCTFCSIPLQFWFLNTIMQNFGLSTNCKRKIYLWDGAMHKIFEITHPFPRELLMFAETMICILSAKYSFLFHHIQNMTAYLRLDISKKLESIMF